MARSVVDATRFTSTTPHASAMPSASVSNLGQTKSLPQRTAGPPEETPQEKVKRLREAAARARDAKISTFDKAIIVGRVWADRAHRFTALSLIGITGIAAAVTAYAIGDMIVYNRRKRAEYFADQRALHSATVNEAQKAISLGTATEEQKTLIEKDESLKQATETKNVPKSPGMLARSKQWLFSGLKKEEEGEDFGTPERRLGYEGMSEEDDGLGERESTILSAIEKKRAEAKEKAKVVLEKERELERTGGPLDRLGTGTETSPAISPKETPKSGGWAAFMSRR